MVGDTVGPGDYEPQLWRNKSAINFGKGSTRKDPASIPGGVGDIPGPGYYNVPGAFAAVGNDEGFYAEGSYLQQLKAAKNQPTAAFRSGSNREILPARVLKETNQGPGKYRLPSTIDKALKKKPDHLQCFSSSEEKFRDPRGRNANMGPDPGAYTPLTSTFDKDKLHILKKKRLASRSDWAMTVSFDSTAPRADFVDNKIAPPPGAYTPQDTLAHRVAKKRLGKSPWDAVYHKTNRLESKPEPEHRTNPAIMLDNKLLEPEGFKPLNEWKAMNSGLKEKPQFTLPFASNVARLPPPDDTLADGPGPGTYNTRPSWMLKNSTRYFPENKPLVKMKKDIAPGPGQYRPDPYGIAGSPDKRRNRKNIMVSTGQRLKEMLKEYERVGPGPGVYNVSKSLITPSHNVLLNPE